MENEITDTLYENYAVNDDDYRTVYDVQWRAQTFTPSTTHKITSVDLKVAKIGSPGTLTVSIRGTDGYGNPAGSDLCSGTYNGDTLGTDTSATCPWTNIPLTTYVDLQGTMYAIVCRSAGGDSTNSIAWRSDETSPAYSGGSLARSADSGSTWTVMAVDMMFKEYGTTGTAYTMAISSLAFLISASAVNLSRPIRNMAISSVNYALKASDVAFGRGKRMAISALQMAINFGSVVLTRLGWDNTAKHSATMANTSKTSATPANTAKNTGTWVNQEKS